MSVQLDNSGRGRLKVPGFDTIPIDYDVHLNQRFTHGIIEWRQVPRLTAREVAMLRLMNSITEKPDWDVDIFNNTTLQLWHAEALSLDSLGVSISPEAWEWCVAELRDKARVFQQTQRIVVFNGGSGVCKSDMVVDSALQKELQIALTASFTDDVGQIQDQNWGRRERIDPSLYPLVYGQTHVLQDGGRVEGIDHLWELWPKGRVAPRPAHPSRVTPKRLSWPDRMPPPNGNPRAKAQESCWSDRYQWLPCEVEFSNSTGADVRISSYINNLRPRKSKAAYTAIERLITVVIDSWNDILVRGGIWGWWRAKGRWPNRIRTYNFEIENEDSPRWLYDIMKDLDIGKPLTREEWQDYRAKIGEYLALPDYDEECCIVNRDDPSPDLLAAMTPEKWESPEELKRVVKEKYHRRWHFHYPEPGISFSYNDWKVGTNTGRPIMDKTNLYDSCPPHDPDPLHHEYYSVSLQDEFRKEGLQVIVKESSIELTPEHPTYAGEDEYHLDGMLNEHIVATAVYYYDVENITPDARTTFQQEDCMNEKEFNYDLVEAVEKVWNLRLVDDQVNSLDPPALQVLGSVATPKGRLLAWPNTIQHKGEPFSLCDSSRPGHQRCIVLLLVDPHIRICSTRNVPPQQASWWADEAVEATGLTAKLPPELVDMIKEESAEWPMSLDEAKFHREETTAERKLAMEKVFEQVEHYDFLEAWI